MMILGFFGIGFMAYRRKQNGPTLRLADILPIGATQRAPSGGLFVLWCLVFGCRRLLVQVGWLFWVWEIY
jgi:hypothetical protein